MSQDKSATWVYVTFSDGITYRFRAEIVARSRAHYFAEADSARGDGTSGTDGSRRRQNRDFARS
jgi:hypothetical protein